VLRRLTGASGLFASCMPLRDKATKFDSSGDVVKIFVRAAFCARDPREARALGDAIGCTSSIGKEQQIAPHFVLRSDSGHPVRKTNCSEDIPSATDYFIGALLRGARHEESRAKIRSSVSSRR
jgi:hypothetical protein